MAYTAIDDPSAHFQTMIYTGDGNDDRALTNDGNSDLQPDLIWFKNRATTNNHNVLDSTRGITARLRPDDTGAEYSTATRLKSFDSDGMTISTDPSVNGDGNGIAAWQWKANGGTRTTNTESGNDPGGGYQANTTAGFSIVDYTGTGAAGTMAHGLGAVPHLMIVRNREISASWLVYHHKNTSAPETDILQLDSTAATYDGSGYWNDTAPTSSVFTINDSNDANKDADGHIAYIWTEIQGFSKFGVYTGNGDLDGPFVYTGFKPAWIMIKAGAIVEHWWNTDNKRNPHNVANKAMKVSDNAAESTSGYETDILSNGFKLRATSGQTNSSTQPYLYMAFAHQPFVTSGGVPCTAF